MKIEIMSFGYKNGHPVGDWVTTDCRHLKNPHNHPQMKNLDGRDGYVKAYVQTDVRFMAMIHEIEGYVAGSNPYGRYAFGCVGGKHRSVVVAETLASRFRAQGHEVAVTHRELE